jgi:hypothetical protein
LDRTKAEVLRYLGRRRQAVPAELDALVESCMALMRETAAPRHVWRIFDMEDRADGLAPAGTTLVLPGQDIRRRLTGCRRVALLAATLGVGADTLIRRWEHTDLTRALVLDACANQLIEEVCDEAERAVEADAAMRSAGRFSPGYGDLPLTLQPGFLAVLDAGRRIGLTCTESLILLPRKSVTALIGLGGPARPAAGRCEDCAARGVCDFAKRGEACP